ncbi:FAD-dependent oxidoreductase [Stieleria varia]|uniref:Flavin-dependent tryptophan halogenase RebH n=1 Tax=Stieleria varia TaxID=2528005 RepID=A0A5C5ZYA3_9BACT|nr:FAD-dependent oxidoreductase [Stieleria varia]TWT91988.1 Flavin-dependent tryptophan halogenase RebH [Stieleria varia]
MTSYTGTFEPIDRIVIVGGGTAGWLSAAYLNQALKGSVHITVVESDAIGPIGVGEATIPSLRLTMGFLGFRDSDWMPEVGATYKSAIKFVNWCTCGPGGATHEYWHPFISRPEPSVLPYHCPFAMGIGQRVSLLHYALKHRLDGESRAIQQMLLPTQSLCEQHKAPINPLMPELSQEYAYHLDVTRLGEFLRQVATKRGVKRVVGHVTNVEHGGNGFITAVETKQENRLSADLFIDCTGFRGLLLNDALGEGIPIFGMQLLTRPTSQIHSIANSSSSRATFRFLTT